MKNLKTVELKPFLPSKDFETSKDFYQDWGFTLASDEEGIAYFYIDNTSFLLQNFYNEELANNLMIHLLVEDVQSWFDSTISSKISEKYSIKVSDLETRPWGMRDFTVHDPSGVLWRVGQNL